MATKLIGERWAKAVETLEANGISPAQIAMMERTFYGGAYGAADVLRVALNRCESPDQFVGVLEEVMAECVEYSRPPGIKREEREERKERKGGRRGKII